jgi:hypothetical protein
MVGTDPGVAVTVGVPDREVEERLASREAYSGLGRGWRRACAVKASVRSLVVQLTIDDGSMLRHPQALLAATETVQSRQLAVSPGAGMAARPFG